MSTRISDKIALTEKRGGGERLKKVIGILCVMGLLLGIASVAMASETDWLLYMRSGAPEKATTFASQSLKLGTAANALDTKESNDTWWTKPSVAANAGATIWDADMGSTDNPPFYVFDVKKSITAPQTKSWTVLVWAGTSYANQNLTLAYWGASTKTVPGTIGGTPYTLTLKVENDPTGTYLAGKTWDINLSTVGSSTAPAGTILFNNAASVKLDANDTAGLQSNAIKLTVTMAPVVPEPGSMLALGSGLVGLVGFAIRRRR